LDQAVDALIGAWLWLGRRTLHGGLGRKVPVGKTTADRLDGKN